jgi:hypothetical protein
MIRFNAAIRSRRLGSDTTLPGGKQVRINTSIDAQTPWAGEQDQGCLASLSVSGAIRRSSGTFYSGRPIPLGRDEIDGEAISTS